MIGEKTVGDVIYRHYSSSEQLDAQARKVTWKFEVEYKGQVLKEYIEEFTLSMDSPETLESLLGSSGFQLLEVFGSYEGMQVDPGKPGFICVATPI
jgi:hypothetical protein